MILEVDCGNTRIKWRVLDRVRGFVADFGATGDLDSFLAQVDAFPQGAVKLVRVVSVRGDVETQALLEALKLKFLVDVRLAHSVAYLAGVTNGYKQPQLLGTDRWMAIVSAYRCAGGACLILDVGTAVTSDFVSVDGLHLGGFICPGMRLMREQLCRQTRRINIQSGLGSAYSSPGKTTTEAVEGGTQLMLAGFVEAQVKMARELLGDSFVVVITGGDASTVAPWLPSAIVAPDLVFEGLALAIPD